MIDLLRRTHRMVAGYLSRAPGTHILFLVIVVTTLVLRGIDAPTATRLLRHESTNLVQMSREAPRVLFLSAFLTDQGRLLWTFVQFTLIMVPVERWLGTYRWLAVFVAGHVGATLATTIGIWLQARGGSSSRDILTTVDVGVSYGLLACAGVLTYRFRRPVSFLYAAFFVLSYGAGVVRHGTFTDWGHICALGIGFAIGPLVRRAPAPLGQPARQPEGVRAPAKPRVGRAAWAWLAAPPAMRHRLVARRTATVLGAALIAVGAAVIVLLATGHGATVAIPPSGSPVSAAVVGRPLGCGAACTTTVVRYRTADGSADALLTTPQHTLLSPGEQLDVRLDPRDPSRAELVLPGRRVSVAGLLGEVAAAALVGGLTLLVIAPRFSPTAGRPRSSIDVAEALPPNPSPERPSPPSPSPERPPPPSAPSHITNV